MKLSLFSLRILLTLFMGILNSNAFGQATLDYYDNLESQGQQDAWIVVNGSQSNKWLKGKHNGSSAELYVSDNNGVDNNYTGTASTVQIYREIAIPATVAQVSINYAYRVRGNPTSYFNVWLVPTTFTPTAGTAITADATRILVAGKQTSNGQWQDAPGTLKQ